MFSSPNNPLPQTGERSVVGAARLSGDFRSDVGCHREGNEDAAAMVIPGDPQEEFRKGSLVVVADGMGGHQAGEVASRIAVETVRNVYYEREGEPSDVLQAAFHASHDAIRARAREDQAFEGMGTTCTALAIRQGYAHVAHVGDSRLYLIRAGQIYLMTEDDSQVMQMVRDGHITREEAHRHEDRNLLLQAMGRSENIHVFTWDEPFPVHAGDRFLLCSDGLHDLVEESALRETISSNPPAAACARLIQAARDNGGYDNITAAVLYVNGAPPVRQTREAEVSS